MSTEVFWIRQGAQQAISNIQASVKSCDKLSPAPDTPKDNGASREKRFNSLCPLCTRLAVSIDVLCVIGDAAGVVRVTATGTSGLSKADNKFREHSKLYWWDEVPAVLQFNPYIKSGYRAGEQSFAYAYAKKGLNAAMKTETPHSCDLMLGFWSLQD